MLRKLKNIFDFNCFITLLLLLLICFHCIFIAKPKRQFFFIFLKPQYFIHIYIHYANNIFFFYVFLTQFQIEKYEAAIYLALRRLALFFFSVCCNK